jgi:hypothetical protein
MTPDTIPPEYPPTNTPTMSDTPLTGSMAKVKGKTTRMAMVTVKPGMLPPTIPNSTPRMIKPRTEMLPTSLSA